MPALRDQKSFAKLTRTVLRDLDMSDEGDKDSESEEGGDESENAEQNQEGGAETETTGETSSTDAELRDLSGFRSVHRRKGDRL